MSFPILTARVNNNAEVFAELLDLYVPDGSLVADVTFGRGSFWREYGRVLSSDSYPWYCGMLRDDGTVGITVVPSDLLAPFGGIRADFRWLPYRDSIFDGVVFDPPYGQLSSAPRRDAVGKRYNCSSARDVYHTEHLYREGILEADRVLKSRGVLIVKCQDQINSGKQFRWSHFVYEICCDFLKMEDLDQFVVVQKHAPMMRHKHQIHARKNHSFFWVFRKRRQPCKSLKREE